MGDHSPLPSKRPRLSITELTELSKEDIVKRYLKQQDYVDQLETKLNASGGTEYALTIPRMVTLHLDV